MNIKQKTLLFSIIAFFFVFFVGFNNVNATVGGPTFIYNFKYNPTDQSIYYTYTSESGRGCPPELHKLSLISGVSSVVFSCSEGEKLLSQADYEPTFINEKINKLTENYKDLQPINLKNNKISIDISYLSSKRLLPDDYVIESDFAAIVYQGHDTASKFTLKGCNTEQPFTFAGYAIPGYEKKIALLVSTKGSCWEGGYTNETLKIVGGVDNLVKDNYVNSYKSASALVPDEGTLVVFEPEKINLNEDDANDVKNLNYSSTTTAQEASFPLFEVIITFIISIIIGVFVGRLSIKK